jgi:hypothetical protein
MIKGTLEDGLHKSSKNFGNDIKTGRLTFNAFFDKFND